MLDCPGAEAKWQFIEEVLNEEGGTKIFPRLEADQATSGEEGNSGFQPGYVRLVDGVVMFVMRPCAVTRGSSSRGRATARRSQECHIVVGL